MVSNLSYLAAITKAKSTYMQRYNHLHPWMKQGKGYSERNSII